MLITLTTYDAQWDCHLNRIELLIKRNILDNDHTRQFSQIVKIVNRTHIPLDIVVSLPPRRTEIFNYAFIADFIEALSDIFDNIISVTKEFQRYASC